MDMVILLNMLVLCQGFSFYLCSPRASLLEPPLYYTSEFSRFLNEFDDHINNREVDKFFPLVK